MRPLFALALAAMSAPALAQEPLCGGLQVLAMKAGDDPFRDFYIDEATGRPASMVVRPAGFDGAYECKVRRDPLDAYECVWVFPLATIPAGASLLTERVKACLAAPPWTPALITEEKGVVVQRFVNSQTKGEVVTLSTDAGGQTRRETLTIFAPKK